MLLGWFGSLIVLKKKQRLKVSVGNNEEFSTKKKKVCPFAPDPLTFFPCILPATAVVGKAVQWGSSPLAQEMERVLRVCAKYGFKLKFLSFLLLGVFALALAWIWV